MDEIRKMDLKDFYAHVKVCLMKDVAEKEFRILLAGGKLNEGKEPKGKFDKSKMMDGIPNKKEQSGTIRHQKTEKAMSFSSKVREVRIK